MKTRWVYLEIGERVRKGDLMHDWNSNTFNKVEDDVASSKFDPWFISKGEHVLRKVVIPAKHLRAAKFK